MKATQGSAPLSMLLDLFVHPALFWTLGLKSVRRIVEADEQKVALVSHEGDG